MWVKIFIYSLSYLPFISVLSQLRFISWSSPPPSLFNWPPVQLYRKVPNHIYVLKWSIIHCLIYFGFISVYICICFGRYSEGIAALTKLSYKLELRMTWFCFIKKIHAMSCFQFFTWKFFFVWLFNFSYLINISDSPSQIYAKIPSCT